jgi:hypothetical protein
MGILPTNRHRGGKGRFALELAGAALLALAWFAANLRRGYDDDDQVRLAWILALAGAACIFACLVRPLFRPAIPDRRNQPMNPKELRDLAEQCRSWPSDDLVRAVGVEWESYVPDAIQIFEKELAARNVPLGPVRAVRQRIEEGRQQRAESSRPQLDGRTMKQVYMAKDAPDAELVKDMLEDEGIPAVVFGEDLQRVLTWATPVMLPTVWVLDGTDNDRATELVTQFQAEAREEPETKDTWRCAKCGEDIEPQFAECWNCGAARP